jgi:serine/threonine-protein kinase RsbT
MPHYVSIKNENDILRAITIANTKMKEYPYSLVEKQKIIVTISELCKNIIFHSGSSGEILIEDTAVGIRITATDSGIGIHSIEAVLNGTRSPKSKGLGLGLRGVKRMMDLFEIESRYKGGTKVIVEKWCNRIPSKQPRSRQ